VSSVPAPVLLITNVLFSWFQCCFYSLNFLVHVTGTGTEVLGGDSGSAGSGIGPHLHTKCITKIFLYLLGSDILFLKSVSSVPAPVLLITSVFFIGSDVAFIAKISAPVPVPMTMIAVRLLYEWFY
jgi:hypothetical protein